MARCAGKRPSVTLGNQYDQAHSVREVPDVSWRRVAWRVAMLLVSALSLYLLAPKLIDVFTSWSELKTLDPLWFALGAFF